MRLATEPEDAEHEVELAASEEALAQRLWEVQETRRRGAAMTKQLQVAVQELEEALGDGAARAFPVPVR